MNATQTAVKVAPPATLADWLNARRDVFPADLAYCGQSLKYFLNGLPVAVLTVSPVELDRLRSEFPPGEPEDDGNGIRSVKHARGELKLILSLEIGEFHLLIRENEWAAGGAYVSIDRLHAPVFADEARWAGADQDMADLGERRLRAVAESRLDTRDSFRMGALVAMTDFELEAGTAAALRKVYRGEEAAALEGRFLQKQFRKLVLGRRPSRGFEALRELGALGALLPELEAGVGLEQNRYHKHDIYYHSIYACDSAEAELALRLAALFHDLGKVDTRKEHANGEASFHNHEIVSTRHTENIMRRLGFPGGLKKRVKFLVRNHMFHYTAAWSDRAVRRFMKKVSTDQLEDLISLRLADRKGSGKRSELPRAIKELMRHIEEVRASEAELKIKDLAIDGHRLMRLGVAPGPQMGRLLRELLEAVKSEELANEADALETAVRERISVAPPA